MRYELIIVGPAAQLPIKKSVMSLPPAPVPWRQLWSTASGVDKYQRLMTSSFYDDLTDNYDGSDEEIFIKSLDGIMLLTHSGEYGGRWAYKCNWPPIRN